ncbi:MAG TPA: alpha/beta hydrolase [Acidimicrobiia bacterium]|nr:alpha/beta hydrolase [Acidimicrobiia bacterium]
MLKDRPTLGARHNGRVGWAYLAVSLLGAWFTYNAYRPSRRWQLLTLSFFAGWFTGELAVFHIVWQVAATVVFLWLGALESWAGVAGLVITLASWAGLLGLQLVSGRSARAMEEALREGLGPDYRSEIAPGLAQRLARRTSRRSLLMPFYLRDRHVERVKNIQYAPGAGRRHLLDVWRPKSGAHRAPVLLQLHGGAWMVGDKGQQALPLMLHLAAEGWVCVAANYRLSPQASFPEHLVDCKLALRWIREHIAEYGGDPDFVVVTGGSAGGHLAALLALTPNDPELQPGFEGADTSVTACVPFYGVYDLAEVFDPRDRAGPRGERLGHWFARRVAGATVEEDPERFLRYSPIAHVGAHAPPFFVIHGKSDNLVPVEQARRFISALRDVSRQPVLYAEIPGASHAFEMFHSVRTENVVKGVDRFLAWLHTAHRARRPDVPADPIESTSRSAATPGRDGR